MDDLTIVLNVEEQAGLAAVIASAKPGTPEAQLDPSLLARQLLRTGLDARLEGLGLPWAPTAQAVSDVRHQRDAWDAGLVATIGGRRQMLRGGAVAAGLALAVALIGGYGFGWHWTGFRANKQLWDWLQLLVLPLALATLPIWLRRSDYLSRRLQAGYTAVLTLFAVFVIVGYEAPLGWTGFQGNRLWDWITLLLLPVILITIRTWLDTKREIRRWHWAALGVLGAAWLLTIIGGYAWNWTWTGYPGNTLWDWLQLTLAPLVIPTIVLPNLLSLTTGNAETRAKRERERGYQLDTEDPAAASAITTKP